MVPMRVVLAALIGAALAGGNAAAPLAQALAQDDAAADYAAQATGPRFTSRGETYIMMPGVWAVPGATRHADPAQALTMRGLAAAQVLGTKGSFVLFREAQDPARPLAAAPARVMRLRALAGSATDRLHPVVWNARTRTLAVVLGNLVATLSDIEQADAIAAATGLRLTARLDRLNVAVFAVNPDSDVLAAQRALEGQPAVSAVEIEVLERVRVPL